MFFLDLLIRPAARSIKLHNHGWGTLDAHLVDAVLITVERIDASVATKSKSV
jgi:hypothetical protein